MPKHSTRQNRRQQPSSTQPPQPPQSTSQRPQSRNTSRATLYQRRRTDAEKLQAVVNAIKDQHWSFKQFIEAYISAPPLTSFHDSPNERRRKLAAIIFGDSKICDGLVNEAVGNNIPLLSVESLQAEVDSLCRRGQQFGTADVEVLAEQLDADDALREISTLAPVLCGLCDRLGQAQRTDLHAREESQLQYRKLTILAALCNAHARQTSNKWLIYIPWA